MTLWAFEVNILALKELGLSLAQIRRFITDDISLEEIQGMLLMKKAELEQQVLDELKPAISHKKCARFHRQQWRRLSLLRVPVPSFWEKKFIESLFGIAV